MKTLEIIVPAFNEEKLLRANIILLLKHVQESNYPVATYITIAVNGSVDRTAYIAQELSAEYPGKISTSIFLEGGKGNAIKKTVLQSKADIILYMDVDLAVALNHISDVVVPVYEGEADLVIASRLLSSSETKRSFLRTLTSKTYNALSRLLLGHSLSDLQCGFKAGSREFFQSVLPEVQDRQWFFDTELVMIGLEKGKRIQEVPVSWEENRYAERKSKVHFISESFVFLNKLFSLRRRIRKRSVVHRHRAAVVLALLIGALYAAPYIYSAHISGYQGIFIAEATDEDFYVSTINKSYQSSSLVGNPYLYEYKDIRNPFQYYAVEYGLGKVGALLHLRIDWLVIAMDFVFPFMLSLVIYWFALCISGRRSLGLMVSAGMMLANEMSRPGITDTINTFLFKSPWINFLLYERPVNPQVSAIFFYLVIISLLSLYRNPKSKVIIVLSGIGLGALAYIYFYFWAFSFIFLGVLGIYALFAKRWSLLVSTTIAGCIGALISLPFLIAAGSTFLHGAGGTLALAVPTHRIIVEKMVLVPLFLYVCLALWGWWSGGRDKAGAWALGFSKKYIFVLLLLIGGVIASNQQVITGKLLQQQHFHFFTNIPLFLLAMVLLLGEVFMLLPRIPRAVAVGAVLFIFFWFGAGEQFSSYKAFSTTYVRYQQLASIYTWINTNAPAGSVILADQHNSSWIPMYTQDFVYNSPYDATYQVPQSRVIHDYFVDLALQGVRKENVRTYVYNADNRNEIGYILFSGLYYRDLCGSAGCFPDSVLENLITGYQDFLSQSLLQNMKSHKVDYILLDSKTDSSWNLNGIVDRSVIESGDFTLYSVK